MGSGKSSRLTGTRVIAGVARSEQMGGCGQSTGIYTPDSAGSGLTQKGRQRLESNAQRQRGSAGLSGSSYPTLEGRVAKEDLSK